MRFLWLRGPCAACLILIASACSGSESAPTYTVRGTVSGLGTSHTLTLILNGQESVQLSNSSFSFTTRLARGTAYRVTIGQSPVGYDVTLANATGTVQADVIDVRATATPRTYAIGGTASGVTSPLTLQNNGGDDLTLTGDGTFAFSTRVPHGSSYAITVRTAPPGHSVSLTSAQGTAIADVNSIVATATPRTYAVGGSVSGLMGSVTLRNNGTDDLVRSSSGAFTFASPIRHGTGYDVSVLLAPPEQRASVGNGSGTIAAANVTNIVVNLTDKTWSHPTDVNDNISPDGTACYESDAAVGPSGEIIVVWRQLHGLTNGIFLSEYRNGTWKHPTSTTDRINPGATQAYFPKVAIGPNGDAVVVWYQNDGAFHQVFKSEYRAGSWSHPTGLSDNISPDGTHAGKPQVTVGTNGQTLIAWSQSNGFQAQVFKSEWSNGTWVHPSSLSDNINPDTSSSSVPEIALGSNGDAIIVWTQVDPIRSQVFLSERRNGTWTHPSGLSDNISPDSASAVYPHVAIGAAGEALIVWQQPNPTWTQIFKSEYRNGTWTHPSGLSDSISQNGASADRPRVAIGSQGDALIAWKQPDGATVQVFQSHYRNGTWTHPSSLSDNISPDGQAAKEPQLAVGRAGQALVVWEQSNGTRSQVFASRHRLGSWTHPTGLTDSISPTSQNALSPHVAIGQNGDAVIVWRQSNGSVTQIFVSEFR